MSGGIVLLNNNAALTALREVSWRVCEWAGADGLHSALEQYANAVRAGLLVACTSPRPFVLWHFTPRAASQDDAFRAPHWQELERGSQPVARLGANAARLLETAIANLIEARLLAHRSYVLLPPTALAPASSLPLLRAGPSGINAALLGTLGVEVATFVQGEQLGIIAQVRRYPMVSVRPFDGRREASANPLSVLVGRKAEEAVLLGTVPTQPGAQKRWQQTYESWFPAGDTRLRVRLRASALELVLPVECVWRAPERSASREVGERLRRQAREALEEAGDAKGRAGAAIKHSASTPALASGGPDDALPLLMRSAPDTAAAAAADQARKRTASQREGLVASAAPATTASAASQRTQSTADTPGTSTSNKRQRGDAEDLYGSSDIVLEQWLASVPEAPPPSAGPQETSPTPVAAATPGTRVLSSSAPQLPLVAPRSLSARIYHCPSAYAPIALPALPQAAYAPRDGKIQAAAAAADKYVAAVDLTALPPPPSLPVARAVKEEQPAREGKGEGDEASAADASDSSAESSAEEAERASPADRDMAELPPPPPVSAASEEADREAAQEEWLLGALINEGATWKAQAEERPPNRSPTDAHVALTVTSALSTPLPPSLLPAASAAAAAASSSAALPPPASFTVSLLVEHFFSSVASSLPALQLQTSQPLALRHAPKQQDDAELVPLEIPQLIAGYEEDWVSVPPAAIPVWDKAVLEPYSPAKDIIFYAVLLGTPALDAAARTFFRELSCMYEACRLGLHRPHDSEPFVSVERAQTDGQQLGAYSAAFQALTKHLLKSSLSYADSSFVVYIVHPFARAAAAAAELGQLASEIVRECSGRNSLVNVAVQMLTTEEVQLREALPLALKELAFSSFTKTRRVAFPHLPAKIYEPLFVLAPLTKEPRENTLHVALARSDDGLWELCAVTDERGELLEVKPFLRTSFTPDALRREIWAFATQFLLGVRDVRWRAAITLLSDTVDEEERALWHEAVCAAPKSEEAAVPLARVAIVGCAVETQLQFLPAGLAPEEPAQTAAAPLHFAVFPRAARRLCRHLDQAAPLLQAYVVSPAPVPAPNAPLPGEPSAVLAVVFYDFCTPTASAPPATDPPAPLPPPPSNGGQSIPTSPIAGAGGAAAVPGAPLASSDVQFARSLTRQLHRLSFLTTSPAWPNRASALPMHLAVLQRLAALIPQTSNFAALAE